MADSCLDSPLRRQEVFHHPLTATVFQQKLCVNLNFHQMQMRDVMTMRPFWSCTDLQLKKGTCLRDDFFFTLPLVLFLCNQQTGI